ncbi:MAG: 50S ribosomal protein L21 [Rhodospirillaceae bacterium]|jgi:large subunit ribosomal protein L21|nr:50S ribosomal protein L21 [Rhodospirillaceae bacterium]|tara:strand:+ start:3790 stop:4359 length:570 start_codon:yes stop_codon:yes gene_type:complete
MFAVIRTGGKQYRVAKDDTIVVEKLAGDPGTMVELSEVLMIGGGKSASIGSPLVDKAAVFAEVMEQSRAGKIIVFKKHRRKNYRRTRGHRQEQTVLRILDVSPTGTKPKGGAKAKAAPQGTPKATPKTEAKSKAKPKAKAEPQKETKKEAKKPAAKKPAAKKPGAKAPAKKKPAAKKKAAPKGKGKSKE